MKINQTRLNIWIYKFMLGTLGKNKTGLLRKELERRCRAGKINSALEHKLLAAFTVDRPRHQYLAELLDDWEKRAFGD